MAVTSVRVVLGVAAAAASLAGLSCSSSDTAPPPSPAIAMTATASGNGQTAQVGTALPLPLRVVVTLSGAPQVGTTVSWAAQGTGASVGSATSVTDASGIATATWTLGSTVGTQNATATLAGATGSPVTFSATATAAPVPLIAKAPTASGDAQSGTVGFPLTNPLRVLVTLSGAAQAGTTVTWAAAGTGAAVNPLTSVTDASGIATTTWTLGQTAGAQSATATLAGATGSPVQFGATAAPRAAAFLSLASGDAQSASVGSPFANPLKVKAADQFGNGVSGVTVTWAVATGSASVAPSSSNTDASGLAQASLTAGALVGPATVTATSGILTGSPVTFNATVAALPTSAAVSVGDFFFKSGRNNSQNPAVDTIAVNGTVTWTWVGSFSHGVQSLASPSFTGSPTQAAGTYQFTFTAAGTYQYDCIVHGLSMTGTIVVK
jgi:plastocyanin